MNPRHAYILHLWEVNRPLRSQSDCVALIADRLGVGTSYIRDVLQRYDYIPRQRR